MARRNLENARERESGEKNADSKASALGARAHRYKFCMLMVMETVGKIEIFLITHSAQVLVFSFLSFFPSLPRLPLGFAIAQCIPRVHTTTTTARETEAKIFMYLLAKHLQLERQRALRAFLRRL